MWSLFGNPQTYIPDMANGTNNFYIFDYPWTVDDSGLDALDTTYSRSVVYFNLDMALQYSTQFIPRNGTQYRTPYVPAVSKQVTGISVDWVSGLMYWSDEFYQRICMFDIATLGFWRPVVDANLTSPQDVAIYPQQSYLFWSDLGENPTIERLDLRTDERRILLSNSTLQRPTKLTIDFASQRLFWLDSAKATIGSMNFDGSNVTLWTQSAFSTISSFALFQNYIFLGSNDTNVIRVYNLSQQIYITNITQSGRGIIDMTVWSQERNPSVNSPCLSANGGCDHFCITVNSTQRRCLCAMGYFLAPNGANCVTKPNQKNRFLLMSDKLQLNIFQIDVGSGEVRALLNNKDEFSIITALTFDPWLNYLYFYDNSKQLMKRTSLDGMIMKPLPNVTKPLGSDITSLAFDGENQILFYVDYIAHTISVMYLSNLSSTIIYSQPGSRPRTIALDTDNRWLYWSDCIRMTIERGSMANPNSNRVSIVSGLSSCAMAFAIDFQSQIIFWGDSSGSIETAMLDGTARRVVFQDSNAAFTGLALDAQFVYIADSNKRQIQKLDRNTSQLTNLTRLLFTQPYALLYYSADTTSAATSSSSVFPPSSTPTDHSSVTTIILASVISGAVVLIAVIVTIGVTIVVKRRSRVRLQRDKTKDESTTCAADIPNTYQKLSVDRCRCSNPETFAIESIYDEVFPQEEQTGDDHSQSRPHCSNPQSFANDSFYDDVIPQEEQTGDDCSESRSHSYLSVEEVDEQQIQPPPFREQSSNC